MLDVAIFLMQDWNQKAQFLKEDMDCSIVKHECKRCKRVFKKGKELRFHEKNCMAVTCPVQSCGRKFESKLLLKRHQVIHSNDNECSICKKTFCSKQSLGRHKASHDSAKAFKCIICDAEFSVKGNLRRHVKTVHT